MKRRTKLSLFIILMLALTASLVAFRPFHGDADEDGVNDYTEALANALGISVEELEDAYQAAHEKALQQAVEEGWITQEQLDALEQKGFHDGRKAPGFRGVNEETFLAEELGISLEDLKAAQQEAANVLLDQALADGTISQEEYDRIQTRQVMAPYFDEAFSTAFQDAIDSALADGAITEEQAESLQNGAGPGFEGFGIGGSHHGSPFQMPGFGFPHEKGGGPRE